MADKTPTLPPELLREAFELEHDLPEVRSSEVCSPNFAKSRVAHVRLSETDLERIQQAARATNRSISDVIRAAILQYLNGRETDGEVQDLVLALHDRGLRLTRG